MENNKRYTIFAGVNGAGKSTLYSLLKQAKLGERINADEILFSNGWDWRDEKAQFKSMRIAVDKINRCIQSGTSFNQETTLSGISIVKTIQAAKEQGFFVKMCYIGLESPELAIERVAKRVTEGGHGIKEEDIRRRYEASLKMLKEVAPLCDSVAFFDNTVRYKKIANLNNKHLQIKDYSIPWFNRGMGLVSET